MKCPHCRVSFHDKPARIPITVDADGGWDLVFRKCPECQRLVIHLENGTPGYVSGRYIGLAPAEAKTFLVRPKGSSRSPCPIEVPKQFADDYVEACLVAPDNPKASAALSRRCLQNIIREKAKVRPGNLADEIQQALDSGALPSYLAEVIDGVRNIGNFAAHPLKSLNTGEIVPVEPAEAEWNLDVLEGLFDFYFVQPTLIEKKRQVIDQKLKEVGKNPMK